MARPKVVINHVGARALLSHPSVEGYLLGLAEGWAARCNRAASDDTMEMDPFGASSIVASDRAMATVVTSTPHGIRHNDIHNTIMKNLEG